MASNESLRVAHGSYRERSDFFVIFVLAIPPSLQIVLQHGIADES